MTTVRSPTSYLCLLYYYVSGALHEWIERMPKIQHGTKLHIFWSPKVSTLWNLSALITSVQVRLPPNPLWDRHSWTAKAEDNTCWDEEWRPPHGQMVGFADIYICWQQNVTFINPSLIFPKKCGIFKVSEGREQNPSWVCPPPHYHPPQVRTKYSSTTNYCHNKPQERMNYSKTIVGILITWV